MFEEEQDHEEHIFALMMDALDGELEEGDSAELATYLADHPDLAAEWDAMQYVETLLRETPPIIVPVNFAERTLAQLPNPHYRRIFLLLSFFVLLIGGMLPIIGGVVAFNQFGGVVPFESFGQSLGELVQLGRLVSSSIFSTLVAVMSEQPVVLGWFSLMVLAIGLWLMLYQQLSNQVVLVPVRVRS